MTSFDDRLAVAQEGIDNLDADGSVDFSTFTSHAHRSMIKDGYWRWRDSTKTEADITWNGYKWAVRHIARGYLTGTPIAPASMGVMSLPQPPKPQPPCDPPVAQQKANPLQSGA